ncbi:peptidylprolyl isomerase [Candidatus Parcubacteria bacterium]|nr:peptidylprolyl isomerase [Candidatus Parcubacteria bacterium]
MSSSLKAFAVVTALLIAAGVVYLVVGRTAAPSDTYSNAPEGTVPATGEPSTGGQVTSTANKNHVILKTNMGEIELELASDKPKTTENFKKLAGSGFYDGVRFHRVIKGFMIQTGDPLSKDVAQRARWGTGGPGYQFADELTGREQYPQGTLAMANSGPNTNGSQFFIVTASPGAQLSPDYTVFGKVVKGMSTALAIEAVKTNSSDQPLTDVIIEKAVVQ